jgi:hypothetical protein
MIVLPDLIPSFISDPTTVNLLNSMGNTQENCYPVYASSYEPYYGGI